MKKWSHREYLTRKAWVDKQWNNPTRTDHYLIRIAQAISGASFEALKIKFEKQERTVSEGSNDLFPKNLTQEQIEFRAKRSKMRWGSLIKIAEKRSI